MAVFPPMSRRSLGTPVLRSPIWQFHQETCHLLFWTRTSLYELTHQENIHLLIYFSTFRKNRGFFCASLLLKMHLGINFFWILGSSSTCRLFRSYNGAIRCS